MEKKKGHKVSIAGDANTHWFTDLMQTNPRSLLPVALDVEDTAVLMYTGGTTGVSKGAQLTHRNVLVNAYQCKVWLNATEGEHVTLTQVPLFHSYGMTTCMNLSFMTANTIILVPDPRDIDDVLKTIDKFKPTLFPGVPAMYVAIVNHPKLSKYDVSSVRACLSGAAGLPMEIQQRFQDATGGRLVEGYGLSESSPVAVGNPIFGQDRIGSIGLPVPDTEVKLVDTDAGEKEAGVGEEGELCIRGPQVMKGYWNLPTETANALRSHDDGGNPWLHTGDIATMDEDGYFRIVDRKKDMILGAGGFNVYPREIEDLLYKHPKVFEAAAVGIPMGDKGERIKVYIVTKPGETATEAEIITFCKENLAAYKIPKLVEFRSELPKTTVGKILRRQLLAEEQTE
jgi:long-chain acyl-CoA synthetase